MAVPRSLAATVPAAGGGQTDKGGWSGERVVPLEVLHQQYNAADKAMRFENKDAA